MSRRLDMKSVKDITVASRRVLVRVDYNLPMDENRQIMDDSRIVATLPLIRHLLDNNAKIILASHMGRPGGKKDSALSLEPVAERLSQLLGVPVSFVSDCVGPDIKARVDALQKGELIMLENLRFHPGEKTNDDTFAQQLAKLCDVYVNDAFAVSHREQASVVGIARHVPVTAAGFLLEKEVRVFYNSVEHPDRPLVAVIGGAKVSSKLAAIENMLQLVDKLIIGGAMANTFLKSQGVDTKGSMIEADLLDTASKIVSAAREKKIELLLPVDLVAARSFDKDTQTKTVELDAIPDKWMALDIGPVTARLYADALKKARTIVWNGPMGVFEMEAFMAGTQVVADAIAESGAYSIVGGGDTGLAARKCGVADKVSYISTGGGAFLHMMEGKKLPGVVALG